MLEKSGAMGEEERRAKVFMINQKRSFFYDLSFEKQVYLLRKTENMGSASMQLAEEIAAQLKLPVDKIHSWMKQRRKRNLKIKVDSSRVKISTAKSILLSAEFARDAEINEDKALVLSFLFNLPKKAVLCWYRKRLGQRVRRIREKQNLAVAARPLPSASNDAEHLYGNQKKTPAQLTVLFEAFKKHSGKLFSRVQELQAQTGLNETAVRSWIFKTKAGLQTKTLSSVLGFLRGDLSDSQLRELQREYGKRKYITGEEAEKIAATLSMNTRTVMRWFVQRRMYELLNGQSALLEAKEPTFLPPSSGMSRVVIQRSGGASKRCNRGNRDNRRNSDRGIPAFKVLRLLKDRRRHGNQKSFSKLAKELGLHGKQTTSWLKNKKYREEMIRRAKLVYGDALTEETSRESKPPPLVSPPSIAKAVAVKSPPTSSEEPSNVLTNLQHQHLFNAYKESRSLTEVRLRTLRARTNLSETRIRNWWGGMSKHMRSKSVEMLEAILKDSCNDEQREKLIALYDKNKYYSKFYIARLVDQIGLNSNIIRNWFVYARLYELKTGAKFKKPSVADDQGESVDESSTCVSSLAWPEIQKLKQEFQKDAVLTDARAKSLAQRLKLRVDKIKEWFDNRQRLVTEHSKKTIDDDEPNGEDDDMVEFELTVEEEEEETKKEAEINQSEQALRAVCVRIPKLVEKTHSTAAVAEDGTSLPFQNEILFREFVKGSQLTPVRLQRLSNTLHLPKKHICSWFSWLRAKVASLPDQVLLENYRNENLSKEQVNILESAYKVTPYPDEERKKAITQRAGLTRATLKTWFANRRYYEILTSNINASERTTNQSDFQPIITSISSASGLSTDKQEDDDGSVCCDKLLNSYSFSSVDLDKIDGSLYDAENIIEPEFVDRTRYIEPLKEDLELSSFENLNSTFWYASTQPGKLCGSSPPLSESDVLVLEGMYNECSRPTLVEMNDVAKRLMVSEQTIFWWFVRKRVSLRIENALKMTNITTKDISIPKDSQCCDVNGPSLSTRPIISPKKKRLISSHQRLTLQKEFEISNFISQSKAKAIAADIKVPLRMIELWFQKRRQALGVAEPVSAGADRSVTEVLKPEQMVMLELEYRTNPTLTKTRVHELAKRLNASFKTIVLWFKERKQQAAKIEVSRQSSETLNGSSSAETLNGSSSEPENRAPN